MSGQRKDLISRTNCVESTCPFSRNIIKSKNKVGRFNPWTDSAYRDSGYYELTVPDLEHIRDAHNGKNRIIRQAHLNQLIARHASFRTVFTKDKTGVGVQKILDKLELFQVCP